MTRRREAVRGPTTLAQWLALEPELGTAEGLYTFWYRLRWGIDYAGVIRRAYVQRMIRGDWTSWCGEVALGAWLFKAGERSARGQPLPLGVESVLIQALQYDAGLCLWTRVIPWVERGHCTRVDLELTAR